MKTNFVCLALDGCVLDAARALTPAHVLRAARQAIESSRARSLLVIGWRHARIWGDYAVAWVPLWLDTAVFIEHPEKRATVFEVVAREIDDELSRVIATPPSFIADDLAREPRH